MSSPEVSTASKTSAGCEPPTRYNSESNNVDHLIDEIDQFLNEYTSDGNELPSNTKATESFEELNSELSEINANDLVNKKTSPESNDIKYVGKNAAVFELLEENERYGVYEYIPNVNNWNVFYKPLPDDQQIQYVKKEPGTDYINNLSNLSFSQYPIIKLEPESIEADNQNQNSMDINQNDLNEISQIWNQPEMNFQQKNINQALQIQNAKKRNESIEVPIENADNSTEYKVYNNDPDKSDIITNAGRRWNPNYKQNNYSDAGHIPQKFRNQKNKNNYKQLDGRYRSTHSKQNVFKKNFKRPFYKTPQENYSSFSAPTHQLSGFNLHSNRFHSNNLIQKPNKILQGINQFGPKMPFKRNNKEPNKYNGINNSQNETISQYKSNINEKSFHNFQLPFVPPTNEVNEPYQDFSEPQLSLNQSDLNNGIQNQLSEDSTFRSKHEQNLYMKNNVSVLPNWSDSYDHLNNNMEMPKSGRNKPYNQYTTETNINIQNRIKSYNQYSINNNFQIVQNIGRNGPLNLYSTNQNIQIEKSNEYESYNHYSTNNSSQAQNVSEKDPLNYLSTNQNIQIEKSDEYEPYNQYSTNNSSQIQITGKNDLSNQFSTNQSIEIKKRSECDKPSNYYPAKKNTEMQKSNNNETYNQNFKNKNFKMQNRGKNEPYNQYLNKKSNEVQKNGENQPHNQNATQKNIEFQNTLSNQFSTNQSIEIKKRSTCDQPSNYYPAKKNIEMQKSNNNETYNQNLNKNFKMQNRGKNEPYNKYLNKKKIEMQKNGENQPYNQNATQNIEKVENDEKSHLSLSTTKNSNKKKIRIGIEEYKYYANNKKNIDMHKSMQVEPYNDYSTKENEEQKTMGVESYNDYSIKKNVKMQKSGGDESCNHFSATKSIEIQKNGKQKRNTQYSTLNNAEISPNNETVEETAVTLVDGKESLNHEGHKYTPVMSLQESHYLIKDYLSPESLVGCTIKLSSRKLANAEIRDKLYNAFAVHGALSNSWWTSDDMFFVTYFERNVALGVYGMYPKNTSSSY